MKRINMHSPPVRPYHVRRTDCTPDEPSPGWYYVTDRGDVEEIHGPFESRRDAEDHFYGRDEYRGSMPKPWDEHEADELKERRLRADE